MKAVEQILQDHSGYDVVLPEHDLVYDLGYDELLLLETVMQIEQDLNIDIDDESIEDLSTVQELYDLVSEVLEGE